MSEPVRVVVDGESFDVEHDGDATYFTWVSGPNARYGFTVGGVGAAAFTDDKMRTAIRGFLSGIDPTTGYLAE